MVARCLTDRGTDHRYYCEVQSARALGSRHFILVVYSMCQPEGQDLLQFKTLLIHGAYPQSTPLRVSLSIAQCERAILISPSRQSLLRDLGNCDDDWLRSSSGSGVVSKISSRVRILSVTRSLRSDAYRASNGSLNLFRSYPPTPKHVVALLSLLRCLDSDNATDVIEPKATVDPPPCLFILHEPSAYFLNDQIR